MNDEIKIETDVPLPSEPPHRYPLDKMLPGDSFFLPWRNGKKKTHSVQPIISKYKKRSARRLVFTTRKVTEGGIPGIRVWRVK